MRLSDKRRRPGQLRPADYEDGEGFARLTFNHASGIDMTSAGTAEEELMLAMTSE
jgi:hypothetical protein